MFKLHIKNLTDLKSALRHPAFADGAWLHGDGNIYNSQKESDDRATFYNVHPANECAKYRLHFIRTSAIPTTLAQVEKMLQDSFNAEQMKKAKEGTAQATQGLTLGGYDYEDEETPAPVVAAPEEEMPVTPVTPDPVKATKKGKNAPAPAPAETDNAGAPAQTPAVNI